MENKRALRKELLAYIKEESTLIDTNNLILDDSFENILSASQNTYVGIKKKTRHLLKCWS
jgi:hypothetical protein